MPSIVYFPYSSRVSIPLKCISVPQCIFLDVYFREMYSIFQYYTVLYSNTQLYTVYFP